MTNSEFNPDSYGIFDGLVIWRGSPISLELTLKNPDGSPLDLTNLEPFSCNVARNAEGLSLMQPTVTVVGDPTAGTINIAATAAATVALEVCLAVWAVKDKTGYRWVGGTAPIRKSA